MKKFLPVLCCALLLFSCNKETTTNPTALPNSYSNQALGASNKDMLTADKYTNIVIQVQYMTGYELDPTTLTNITEYLSSICNKPGGITISQTEINADGGDTLTVNSVALLEKQYRTAYTNDNTLELYVLVTDGYDTAVNTLGFAYRCTSICLFGANIFTHSGGFNEVSRVSLESSVLEHELGHIMGLVNLTTSMVIAHQDVAHGYHCNNPECLMYYAMETNDALGMLGSNNIPVLDSNCMNDLHAEGGK